MSNRGHYNKGTGVNNYRRNRDNNKRRDTTEENLSNYIKTINDILWGYFHKTRYEDGRFRDNNPETFTNFLLNNKELINEIKKARDGITEVLNMIETKRAGIGERSSKQGNTEDK